MVKEFDGVFPSQVNPAAETLVTVVVYVPLGACGTVNVTDPLEPVVPVPEAYALPLRLTTIETDAFGTAAPRLLTRLAVICKFRLFLPESE